MKFKSITALLLIQLIFIQFDAFTQGNSKYKRQLEPTEGLSIVENQQGKWGLIDSIGREVIPCIYEEVSYYQEGLVPAKLNGVWGVLNRSNKWVIQPKYENVSLFIDGMARVKQNSKYGTIDRSGKIIVPISYDRIGLIGDERIVISTIGDKSGILNWAGNTVVPMNYKSLYYIGEGLLRFKESEQFGLMNSSGQIIVQPAYDAIMEFSDGMAIVRKAQQGIGFINKSATLVIPCNLQGAAEPGFKNGIAIVKIKGKWGAINKIIEPQIPFAYANSDTVGKLLMELEKPNSWHIWENGNISKIGFDNLKKYSNGFLPAKKNGKWGMVNRKGEWLITPQYDAVSSFSSGLAKVSLNGKMGYVNTSGRLVIPLEYDIAGDFHIESAVVMKAGKYFLINQKGEKVRQNAYDYMDINFTENWTKTYKDGIWGLLHYTGGRETNGSYDAVRSFSSGMAAVRRGKNWGFVDNLGLLRTPLKYTKVTDFIDGIAKVSIDEVEKFIYPSGNEVERPLAIESYGYYQSEICFSLSTKYLDECERESKNARNQTEKLRAAQCNMALSESYETLVLKLGAMKWLDRDYNIFLSGKKYGLIKKLPMRFIDAPPTYDEKNITSQILFEGKYDNIFPAYNDRLMVQQNGLYGYIDGKGQEVIPPVFEMATYFIDEKFAAVKTGGKWGLISPSGKWLLAANYHSIGFAQDGIVPIQE